MNSSAVNLSIPNEQADLLIVNQSTRPVVRIAADGRIYWLEREVTTAEEFRAAMREVAAALASSRGSAGVPAPVSEMLSWAYSKLHHYQFLKLNDALMLDRLKNFNEHGLV